MAPSRAVAIGRIFREESGRSVATLIRVFGQIDVGEDAVEDAFALARDGMPPTRVDGSLSRHGGASSRRHHLSVG